MMELVEQLFQIIKLLQENIIVWENLDIWLFDQMEENVFVGKMGALNVMSLQEGYQKI